MTAASFFQLLARRKLSVSIFFILALCLPVLEVASFSLIYLILAPDRAAAFLGRIAARTGWSLPTADPQIRLVVLGVALTCILLWALGRLLRIRQLATIKYGIYEKSLSGLMDQFLMIPGWESIKENPDQVTNVAVHQIGSMANYFVNLLDVASNGLSLLILAAASFLYAPLLALLAGGLAAASIVINRRNFVRLQNIAANQIETDKDLLREVRQVLNGLERIKFDMLESPAIRSVRRVIARSRAWRFSKALARENVSVLSDSFGTVSMVVIVFFGIALFGVQAATFTVLLLIFSRLRGYTTSLQTAVVEMRECRPGIAVVNEMMSRLKRHVRRTTLPEIGSPMRVRLSEVGFSYGNTPVFSGATFTIEAGDRILVRGPSGQGKSTFLRVLTGFYPPTSGHLEVGTAGGWSELDFERLRRHCFYCADDLYVFDTTARSAVDYAGTASDEAILHALRQSCLLALVESWPDGLDSPVGDNGQNLSLGQRERLLLARLFLRKPQLVILDEATSNIDVETERTILENIEAHLSPESTFLIASHRASSAIAFNKSLSVRDGRVEMRVLSEGVGNGF